VQLIAEDVTSEEEEEAGEVDRIMSVMSVFRIALRFALSYVEIRDDVRSTTRSEIEGIMDIYRRYII